MSTVKISELALINQLNANTSNTLFVAVDVPSGVTGKFTGHTLAQGLYSNEILNVGLNQTFLPNTIAQYSLAGASYIQTNLVNLDDGGTADIVVTANANSGGTDSAYFIDMGFANANVTPGLEFNNLGTSISPLDGYLYVQGDGVGNPAAPGGNLVVGATSTGTEIKFVAGGYDSSNIVAKVTHTGFKLVNGHPLHFTDGTTQNTASSPVVYSQSSYTQANTATTIGQSAYVQANTATTIGQSSYTQANTATTIGQSAYGQANTTTINAQAAFTKANNALANTNGAVFGGTLNVTGDIRTNGFVYANVIGSSYANTIQWYPAATTPAQTDGQLWYNGNTKNLVADTDIPGDRPGVGKVLYERVYNNSGGLIDANTWVRLAGAVTTNSVPHIVYADATTAANSVVTGFIKNAIANGSYGFSYTKGVVDDLTLSGFIPGDLIFLSTTPGQASNVAPYGQSLSTIALGKVIKDSGVGAKIQVDIIPAPAYGKVNGSIMYANNNLLIASNTAIINESAGTLYVPNGLVYNQRSYPDAQTAITLNFQTDTWVRTNVSTNLAVTLGNFVAGSDIVLFITNTSSPASHTITHGCSALNSTVGATTFTLSGLTTARIKYYSFDGDLANTYASISFS
jgi:hypothetical protein